jgi:hypothetical protein
VEETGAPAPDGERSARAQHRLAIEDALGQGGLHRRELHRRPDVDVRVPDALPDGQLRLHRCNRTHFSDRM